MSHTVRSGSGASFLTVMALNGVSFVGAVLGACSAARVVLPPTETPHVRTLAAIDDGVFLLNDADPTAPPSVISVDSDGTRNILMGSLRYQVTASGKVVSARDATADALYTAVRVGSDWYFIDTGGLVVTSATFTGPLREVLQLPFLPMVSIDAWQGVITVVSNHRAVTLVPGSAPVEHVFPDTLYLRRVLADSAGTLFVLSREGILRVGHDVDSLHVVPTQDAVYDLLPLADGVRIATSQGVFSLSDDRLVPATDVSSQDVLAHSQRVTGEQVPLSDADHEALQNDRTVRACLLGDVGLAPDMTARRRLNATLKRADGLVACVGGQTGELGTDVFLIDPARNELVRQVSNALPASGCTSWNWGPSRLAVLCDDKLYTTSDGEKYTILTADSSFAESYPMRLAFSDDGAHIAFWGSDCPTESTPSGLCIYTEGSGWKSMAVPADVSDEARLILSDASSDWETTGAFIAMHGSSVALTLYDKLVWFENGSARTIPVGRLVEPPRFLPDGTLTGWDATDSRLWRVDLAGTLTTIDVPSQTKFALTLDGQRAWAFSANINVAQTVDAGAHWNDVSISRRGTGPHDWTRQGQQELADRDADEDLAIAFRSRCTGEGCTIVGNTTTVTLGRIATAANWRGDVIVGKSADVLPEKFEMGFGETISCEIKRRGASVVRTVSQYAGQGVIRPLVHPLFPGVAHSGPREASGTAVLTSDGHGGASLDVSWKASDGRRMVPRRAALTVLPTTLDSAQEFEPGATTWSLLDATASAVAVSRCTSSGCSTFIGEVDRPLVLLDVESHVGGTLVADMRVSAARLTRDNGLIAMTQGTRETDSELLIALRFKSDGTYLGHRDIVSGEDFRWIRGIGRVNGQAGIGWGTPAGEFFWLALEEDLAVVPRLLASDQNWGLWCHARGRPLGELESIEMTDIPSDFFIDTLNGQGFARSTRFEISTGSVCRRTLISGVDLPADRLGLVPEVREEDVGDTVMPTYPVVARIDGTPKGGHGVVGDGFRTGPLQCTGGDLIPSEAPTEE